MGWGFAELTLNTPICSYQCEDSTFSTEVISNAISSSLADLKFDIELDLSFYGSHRRFQEAADPIQNF
jgi:hypothetical protein